MSTFRFYDGKEILYGKVVIIIVKNRAGICTRKSRTKRRDSLLDLSRTKSHRRVWILG